MQLPEPVPDFEYFDGAKMVHADRLALHRQLLILTRGKPNELANKVFAVKPDTDDVQALMESLEAAEQLVKLIRGLFQMQSFNPATGQGARDEHCWAVWNKFCDSMADEKKNPETSPTTSAPTAAPVSSQLTHSTSASS